MTTSRKLYQRLTDSEKDSYWRAIEYGESHESAMMSAHEQCVPYGGPFCTAPLFCAICNDPDAGHRTRQCPYGPEANDSFVASTVEEEI